MVKAKAKGSKDEVMKALIILLLPTAIFGLCKDYYKLFSSERQITGRYCKRNFLNDEGKKESYRVKYFNAYLDDYRDAKKIVEKLVRFKDGTKLGKRIMLYNSGTIAVSGFWNQIQNDHSQTEHGITYYNTVGEKVKVHHSNLRTQHGNTADSYIAYYHKKQPVQVIYNNVSRREGFYKQIKIFYKDGLQVEPVLYYDYYSYITTKRLPLLKRYSNFRTCEYDYYYKDKVVFSEYLENCKKDKKPEKVEYPTLQL